MSDGWEPIPWTSGFFRRRRARRGFIERAHWPLEWREAGDADWPSQEAVAADFDWARRTGTGYTSDSEAETLYLIERDWFGWPDPPQWGLASRAKADGKWHLWGSFDDIPAAWTFVGRKIS